MPQIVVENLSKSFRVAVREPGLRAALGSLVSPRFRVLRALDGMSFALEAGELCGYIGPNGAGKSTTIKVLAGILVPDPGSRVEVDGRVPWRDRAAHVARLGVVFGQRSQLWWICRCGRASRSCATSTACRARHERSLAELVALLDLGELLDVPARQLSLGQRMRCDLAAALVHEPSLLFLDEPTIGLDAGNKVRVRDFIRSINRERGVTVILTTHDMDDIEALCRRVLVIGDGRVLCDGTLAALRAQVSRERHLILHLSDERTVLEDPDVRLIERRGAEVRLGFDPGRVVPSALIARLTASYEVRDLFVEDPPIDTIIQRLYEAEAARARTRRQAGA
jgi:ABC-2 type transport system ATP-binding protein